LAKSVRSPTQKKHLLEELGTIQLSEGDGNLRVMPRGNNVCIDSLPVWHCHG